MQLQDFRLAAFDMDSTLINIECVDEIASAIGRGPEVAAMTSAAMQGEFADYKESLRRRVALLKGTPLEVLHTIYNEKLSLNPGVETTIHEMKAAGIKLLLVSGGFTFFSDRICSRLGFDFSRANTLEIEDERLTGQLVPQSWGEIVDGEEKKSMVLQTAAKLQITPNQIIAIGDGANDLPMMSIAGLSVAYHAKDIVQQKANFQINSGGMDELLRHLQAA